MNDVKVSAFPKCWINDICSGKMDLFSWMRIAQSLEPDGLELYNLFLRSYRSTYLNEVRTTAASYGFELPMMCYSPDFTHPDSDYRKQEVEKQKEIIKVTAELGGRYCRTLSGQRRPEVSVQEGVKYVIDAICQCLPVAQENNVFMVIENHYKDGFWSYPEFAQKKAIFYQIVDAIDSPWFGVQYDPSNTLVAGEDPLEVLEHVKHRVMTVHASDRYLVAGNKPEQLTETDCKTGYADILQHGVTGEGLNDYNKIFSILAKQKFKGWISIEDGLDGMDQMSKSIRFIKNMRTQYFGTSANG